MDREKIPHETKLRFQDRGRNHVMFFSFRSRQRDVMVKTEEGRLLIEPVGILVFFVVVVRNPLANSAS
jgi:hypothetical protein